MDGCEWMAGSERLEVNKWVDDWEMTAGKQLGIDDWVDGCECTAVDGGLGVDILE